jgi:hypothetical protein
MNHGNGSFKKLPFLHLGLACVATWNRLKAEEPIADSVFLGYSTMKLFLAVVSPDITDIM